jgi:hypothetical protein
MRPAVTPVHLSDEAVAMGTMNPRFLKPLLAILTAVWTVVPLAPAQETTLRLDAEKTTVRFTLAATLHTVHGTFRLKKGAIKFDPATGTASGAVVVDAASGETGNQRRDRTMHRDVLVSERYPEITFTPTRVAGAVQPQSLGDRGDRDEAVSGALLHGDHTRHLGEQGVISPQTDVPAGLEGCAALADEDRTGRHLLAAETLHAQPLGVAVATVPRAALTFLVCHFLLRIRPG